MPADPTPTHPNATLATRVHAPAATLPPAERYIAVRLHAQGGLGEVHYAEDAELGRPVALKRIQEARADDTGARRRFLREAEVTAKLQHPGIVPVYGLTHDADGRPSYAMRFVEGESLEEALKQFHAAPDFTSLAFRELLQHFVAVCNAVAYAHSRGVVHRDLKPANVMLGPFGETLVVDWGVARTLDRTEAEKLDGAATVRASVDADGERTQMGQAVGTPAYMSPEQAAGRWDVLGPASDVYSLGATLYALLTGRPPIVSDTWPAMQQRIQRSDYPAARSVNPAVPAALDSVCHKAMALEPNGRYTSALELAADVRQWLADEPVTAYREPAAARLRRWTRRHARLVAGAAAALAVGLVAAGFVAWQSERAREAVEKEKAETVKERDAKETERAKAVTERDRAVAARKRTRAVLDAMVSGVTGDSLATQKTVTDEQKRFLRNAATYYEEFAAELGEEREARVRLALAYNQLGLIRARLGQNAAAATAFRRSAEFHAKLADEYSLEPIYRNNLATNHNNLAVVLSYLDRADGLPTCRAAVEQATKLVADFPTFVNGRVLLATAYSNLGGQLMNRGRFGDAEKALRDAAAVYRKLASDFPDDAQHRKRLVDVHHNLTPILAMLRKYDEAEAGCRAALALCEQLASESPPDAELRHDTANCRDSLANVLTILGRTDEAKVEYRAAVAEKEKLVGEYPAVPLYAIELGGGYCNYGIACGYSGDFATALTSHTKAVERLSAAVAADPSHGQARQFLANSHVGRATALVGLKRYAEALADCERAAEYETGPNRLSLQVQRAICQAHLGRVAEATATANKLATAGAAADLLADCARAFAIAAAAEGNPAAADHAARAVALLRRAYGRDYREVSATRILADFDALRPRDDFAALLWDVADGPR